MSEISTPEPIDQTATETIAAVPVKTGRAQKRSERRHARQIDREDRQRSKEAAAAQPPTPEDKKHKRNFRYVAGGTLAIVAVAAVAGGGGYVYGREKPKQVPGTTDEGLLIKEQIQAQAANRCLDAAAGRIILHKGAVVYETPEIIPGGSHANVESGFISKKKAQDVPYPVRINRNGASFYEFSPGDTAATGDLGAPDIAEKKLYVSQSDHAVEWQPDTSITATSLCAELDPAGNIVLTHGNTLIAYSQPIDETALPATQKLDQTSQDVLASLK